MKLFVIFLMTVYVLLPEGESIRVVSRREWKAKAPKSAYSSIQTPVELVVIHHSETTGCQTDAACRRSMRDIQQGHFDRQFDDFGYHFAVGGNGVVYEGRGWGVEGAHARSYNRRSVGICAIGDFDNETPSSRQLQSIKDLIREGVRRNHISENYKLIGHRQVNNGKTCPGSNLWDEINRWDNYDSSLSF